MLADAGTPLMWAGLFHLAIGNALIGLFEAALLVKFFSLRKGRTLWLLIAANYFSAWIGGWLVCGPLVRMLKLDLNNAWLWFWILVVVTYLMTLVLEWPFVALSFRGSKDWFKRSLKGNLLVQSASYLLIFGWYWMAGNASLYTQTHLVSPEDISLPKSVLVYFISDQTGDVYVRNLSPRETHKVFDLKSTNEDDRLFVRQEEGTTNCWDLEARIGEVGSRDPKLVMLKGCFAHQAILDEHVRYSSEEPGTWFNFGMVPKLGDAGTNPPEFYTGFWAAEGLHSSYGQKEPIVHLAFETPFVQWTVRNATQLPTDEVIFQLGEDQICIFDPASKKVALLEHGRGPVVALAEKNDAK
ncbi:MAG TPA: hypothetical protein VN048_04220 [Verrucomicrobiae bacterium]|nr:hypothetical protein [Verrucomicrobiae bacterium]